MASSLEEVETEPELEPEQMAGLEVPPPAWPPAWQGPSEFILRKYVLMLATLVATVTYGVGFKPPGGVWQDNVEASSGGHLAGEAILRTTNQLRYLVFFYCNAFAFASSVLVIVIFLLLSIDMAENDMANNKHLWIKLKPLRVLMVLDLVSFMGAYASGSCGDTLTTVYTSVLMAAAVLAYLTVQIVLASRPELSLPPPDEYTKFRHEAEERLRKGLMLLATFAVSITYVAGLSSPPGGFMDHAEGGHRPGDAVLDNGRHKARLTTFLVCNTTTFTASLLIIMLLLGRKLHQRAVRFPGMLGCVTAALVGLIGAYAAGSNRNAGATTYVVVVVAAALLCSLPAFHPHFISIIAHTFVGAKIKDMRMFRTVRRQASSSSLLLLLATFATAITYPAGLAPPGGVWQDSNTDGHLAGNPILLMTNTRRYYAFYCCNSFAFVASLVIIILFLSKGYVLKVHVVETVMMLELFGLIGAYAAGACRDVSTSIYVMALAGAVLFYVVIHIILFSLEYQGPRKDDHYIEKKRKLLYLLATLSTSLSYQAGLNPPGGFWLQDGDNYDQSGSGGRHHIAGEPVLLYNHPGHHNAFFYCNSLSFMMSTTTMILLMTPVLYKPAIESYALTLCTVASLTCLMGAYAAGSTQHLRTSFGIYVLVAIAFLIVVISLAKDHLNKKSKDARPLTMSRCEEECRFRKDQQTGHKQLMLLGILMAGITYQSGLDPPGGVWQSDTGGHDAGNPAMQDSRRHRYLAFFYSNSASFAASIAMLLMLCVEWRHFPQYQIKVMRIVVVLDLLALLGAYTTGSSRDWKSSLIVAALVLTVFTYITVKVMCSILFHPGKKMQQENTLDGQNVYSLDPV